MIELNIANLENKWPVNDYVNNKYMSKLDES